MPIAIRIKRGTGAAPTSLLRGELAYYEDEQRLYIGEGDSGNNDENGLPIAQTVRELTTPPVLLEQLSNINVGGGASEGDVLVYNDNTGEWVAEALAIAWDNVTSKPATFTPSTHASSHHTGGGDAIAPADIGAAAAGHTHAATEITGLADVAKSGDYADLGNIPSTFTPAAHNHNVTLELCGLIESPEAKTYVISPAIPAAITITNVKAKTSEGTVDIKLQDDGVDITNTTIGDVGTSVAAPATAPSASVAADSVLALVVSDLQTSPKNLAFTIHYTVTSANNA